MFSLNWFTTVPGILITVGVLLLVVALIIFIITSIKDKKKGKTPAEIKAEDKNMVTPQTMQAAASPAPVTTAVATPAVQTSAPITEVPTVPVATTGVPSSEVITTPVTTPDTAPAMPQEPAPITAPVEVPMVGIMPQDTATPVTSAPSATYDATSIPTIPVVETPSVSEIPVSNATIPNASSVPSVEQVVPEMQDVSQPTINVNNAEIPTIPVTEPQIYGGATPSVTTVPETEHHEIYGGANPLESTQQIPISEITSNNINVNNENPAGLTSIDSVNQNNPQ